MTDPHHDKKHWSALHLDQDMPTSPAPRNGPSASDDDEPVILEM